MLEKKQVVFIFIAIFVLSFFAYFSISFFKKPFTLTGFAIYTNQSNETYAKDTYIKYGGGNYDGEATLKIGKTVGGAEYKSFLDFNISSIPSGDTIVLATLQVYTAVASTNNVTLGIYRVTSNWNEASINWTYRTATEIWDGAGGDYNPTSINSVQFANQSGVYYNFTITDLVRNWVNGSYTNYGLVIIAPSAANGEIIEIASSSSATESQRPLIFIDHSENAVPVISNFSVTTTSANPARIGEQINFTAAWSDIEGNPGQLFICNTSEVNATGCINSTFCNTTSFQTSPLTCSYTTVTSNNRTTNFWAYVCDGTNCSNANSSRFYINHLPIVEVKLPNGGETINITANPEGYQITFNISDADSDNLIAKLYYGDSQNSTTSVINSSLNLSNSNICTDSDGNTATTPNNCWYWWNTTGIHGVYYLTIIVNDSYHTTNDSSNAAFNVYSLEDQIAPNITAQWIDSGTIYSGRRINFYANISEPNLNTVWVSVNGTSQSNYTMTNSSSVTFNYTWPAGAIGNYSFKVYANDTKGNLNNSMSWANFNITKPTATTQNETAPSTALPFHVIKMTGQLNATDPLENIYAYLYVPDGFTFLSDYPQNSLIGNFTANQTRTATWYLSTPITESTYILNITYTDGYSNIWNSSNTQITTTSAIGGYELSTTGYPEVETGNNYYAEAYFKQSGSYVNPDSISINIYDPLGQLTFGPLAMSQESTGIYNYTRNITSGQTEGQWETIVNATKNSNSYYAHEFWKVVGGPFDIRSITVIDSTVSALNISFIAENTGGANKDLILTWNLTKVSGNVELDSGSETRMVPANSEVTWSIQPSTDYVGPVKITLLGYYSGTEKAGAYKIFSTTESAALSSSSSSGGGGGGGATISKINETVVGEVNLTIKNFEDTIYLTKNIEKIIPLIVKNTGNKKLTDLSLTIKNLESRYYTITPESMTLNVGETGSFKIKFLITDFSGEKESSYLFESEEMEKTQDIKLIVLGMKEYFTRESKILSDKIEILKQGLEEQEREDLLSELKKCEDILNDINERIKKEEYLNVQDSLSLAEKCVSDIDEKTAKAKEKSILKEKIDKYGVWVVTWILILALIAVLILIAYKLNKKMGLINFMKQSKKDSSEQVHETRADAINNKLKNIKQKLGKEEAKKVIPETPKENLEEEKENKEIPSENQEEIKKEE